MADIAKREDSTPAEQQAVGIAGEQALGEVSRRAYDVYFAVTDYMVERTEAIENEQHRRYMAIHTEGQAQQLDEELRRSTAAAAENIRFFVENWWRLRD